MTRSAKNTANPDPDKTLPSGDAKSSKAKNVDMQTPITTKSIFTPRTHSTPAAANNPEVTDDDSEIEDEETGILDYVADNNDRFANIIERMDHLERENQLLRQQKEDAETRDRRHIHDTYEQEIAESRRLLDEIAGDKAAKEIECSRLNDQVADLVKEKDALKTHLDKLEGQLASEKNTSQTRLTVSQKLRRDLEDLNKAFGALEQKSKELLDDKKNAMANRDMFEADAIKYRNDFNDVNERFQQKVKEAEDQKVKIDSLQKACEREATQRVDLQNKLQSANEANEFATRVHGEEMASMRGGRSSTFLLTQDSRFQKALQEMRDEYESEQQNIVSRLKHQHEQKITSLEHENQQLRDDAIEKDTNIQSLQMTAQNERRSHSIELSELKTQVAKFRAELDSMKSKMASITSDKEKIYIDLMSRKAVWAKSEKEMNDEIKTLKNRLEQKTITESQLRSELGNFRTLMEHAEERHKMKSPTKLAKRRKRRVSQIAGNTSSGMTPQQKKMQVKTQLANQMKTVPSVDDDTPQESLSEEQRQKDCIIM